MHFTFGTAPAGKCRCTSQLVESAALALALPVVLSGLVALPMLPAAASALLSPAGSSGSCEACPRIQDSAMRADSPSTSPICKQWADQLQSDPGQQHSAHPISCCLPPCLWHMSQVPKATACCLVCLRSVSRHRT